MNRPSPEQSRLPSPECILPNPEDVTEAVTEMHGRLFDAALQPMFPPEQTLFTGGSTEWTVEAAGITLRITKNGQFNAPPTLDTLKKTGFFELKMRTGEGGDSKGSRLTVFHGEGDELTFSDYAEYSDYMRMSDDRIAAGKEMLHSFLAGGIQAGKGETHRRLAVLGEDGSMVSASERITRIGDEPPRTESTIRIQPNSAGDFSFDARIVGGEENASVEYRDVRDYEGPFGIELEQLVCSGIQKGLMEIEPARLGSEGRAPWRIARDRQINQTRDVLTDGRLKEVRRRVDLGLQQLAQYHDTYITANGQY